MHSPSHCKESNEENSVFVCECYSQAKKDNKQTNQSCVAVIRAMANSGIGQV